MITLYQSPSCASCRKAEAWLKKNNLEYRTINILVWPPSEAEIRRLLILAEDVYDVVSVRSNVIQDFQSTYGIELEDLTVSQLTAFLHEHPTAFRWPLVTDGRFLVSGYDEDEMTVLLPRQRRLTWTGRNTL